MDYSDWTTFPEDMLSDGKYLVAVASGCLMEETVVLITILTGVVINQTPVLEEKGALTMPSFVGFDEIELRRYIIAHESPEQLNGVEYSITEYKEV